MAKKFKEGSKKEEMTESPKERRKEAKAGEMKKAKPMPKAPKFKPGGGY